MEEEGGEKGKGRDGWWGKGKGKIFGFSSLVRCGGQNNGGQVVVVGRQLQ